MCSHFSLRIEKHCKCELDMAVFSADRKRGKISERGVTWLHGAALFDVMKMLVRGVFAEIANEFAFFAPWHSAPIYTACNHCHHHNHVWGSFCLQAIYGRWNRVRVFPGSLVALVLFIKLFTIISFQVTESLSTAKILWAKSFFRLRNAVVCEEGLKLETKINRASANVERVNDWADYAECFLCQEKTWGK